MPRLLAAVFALLPSFAVAQPPIDPAKPVPVDAATLQRIETKRAELAKAIDALPGTLDPGVRADITVYLKAVEWQVRHGEFFGKEPWKQTLAVLDAGLARAKAADAALWRQVRGKPVGRGYVSAVDGSVQPYAVNLPDGFDPAKPWRLDVVLHGRDATITETKFLAQRESAKPGKAPDRVVLDVYGRGNNAYRWAGERDVFEAIDSFIGSAGGKRPADVVLKGFSMGGAGTWQIGLHHPFRFSAIGPGAGFTTTRGYIKTLPPKLPDYVEKCLHIYDAVDYAENAFHVPVVAYSGGNDPQKAAADNIERALKGFAEPLRFTHLVAPGLEHKQPPEWVAKQEAEFGKYVGKRPAVPDRVRFVTYTTRYPEYGWGNVLALDRHYDRAVVDGQWSADDVTLTTKNVRAISLFVDGRPWPKAVTLDGQAVGPPHGVVFDRSTFFVKMSDRWRIQQSSEWLSGQMAKPQKSWLLRGPIDDAFLGQFVVLPPAGDQLPTAERFQQFVRDWDKFFRGRLPVVSAGEATKTDGHLVLFGTPDTNALLAAVMKRLPIEWTADKLVVNGTSYDPKTHFPVMIYPNPLKPTRYVVVNSGHTFTAADLKGTNANLYPRLGDWAVLKVTPKGNEVVAAGLFDEFWQFQK